MLLLTTGCQAELGADDAWAEPPAVEEGYAPVEAGEGEEGPEGASAATGTCGTDCGCKPSADPCQVVGCADGVCRRRPALDGTPCLGGRGSCQAGSCSYNPPPDCPAPASECILALEDATGSCIEVPAPRGTACWSGGGRCNGQGACAACLVCGSCS